MENNELKEKVRKNMREKIAISSIKKEFDMKVKKTQNVIYWITSCAAVFILGFGIIITVNQLNNNQIHYEIAQNDELDNKDNETEQREDVININSYQLANQVTSIADMTIDGKWIDCDLSQEFPNIKDIKFPTYLSSINQGKVFGKLDKNDKDYSKLLLYSLVAGTSDGNNAYVQIDISIDNYAQNCYWNYDDIKDKESSFINNTEVKLFMSENSEDKTKISGIAFFEYDNYKYRIEVYKISQDEFIEIIKTLTKINK